MTRKLVLGFAVASVLDLVGSGTDLRAEETANPSNILCGLTLPGVPRVVFEYRGDEVWLKMEGRSARKATQSGGDDWCGTALHKSQSYQFCAINGLDVLPENQDHYEVGPQYHTCTLEYIR